MKSINLSHPARKAISTAIILMCLALGGLQAAALEPATGPEVVIKISRLGDALDLIDKLAAEHTRKSGTSPTTVVRGSLMGTSWIDSQRPMVIGVAFENGAAKTTALVPFKEPNADFQSAYSAKSGPDYYLVTLPQGTGGEVSAGIENALLAAGSAPQEKLISIDVALGRLIEANGDRIDQMLAGIESPPKSGGEQPPPSITAEEARSVLKKSIQTLKQVDALTIDFDLNQETLSLGYQVVAAPGSQLAETLIAGGETVSLADPPSTAQVSFASRSYNLAGILALLGDTFGDVYQKMGTDFAGLEKISRGFTGEMVGGLTLEEDRVDFGFMAILSKEVSPDEFLEKEYLPWLLEYGHQMREVVEAATGAPSPEPIVLTPESAVNGRRVFGCRIEMPMAVVSGPAGPVPTRLPITAYEMRMATTGPVLVLASSDARLAKLLGQTDGIQARPAEGPLMSGEIDLASYLATLKSWVQQDTGELPTLPPLGKVLFEGDMADGRASFGISARLKDITALVAYAAALKPAVAESSGTPPKQKSAAGNEAPASAAKAGTKVPPPGNLKVPPQREAVAVKKDAAYWADKAYLCTTYGNDEAAIHFFKKAIALSPGSSNLYFQMGVSYAELGYYQAALAAIDKAIDIGGTKGLYYFGRGRVLLQSGKTAAGRADIQSAAALGDPDAIQYINDPANKPAQN